MEDILKQLISRKTLTSDISANQEALLFCQKLLEEKGIPSSLLWHTKHPSLHWGAPSIDASIMLNSHIDVVPAPDASFVPITKNGRMVGRGTADTKSFVSTLLHLPKDVVENATKAGVCFALVSDEEIGGDTTKTFLPEMKNLKFALFGEPTQLKLNNEAKGIMQIRITEKGESSHGSRPWLGRNAIILLSSQLKSFIEENPEPKSYTWETTFSFNQINGGTAINQVPATCELLCDVRFNSQDNTESILAKFHKHFGKENVEVLREESIIFTPQDNKFISILSQELTKNEVTPEFSKELGSSDARHCTKLGIASLVFGPIGEGSHENEEWVDLESVKKVHQTLQGFLTTLTN